MTVPLPKDRAHAEPITDMLARVQAGDRSAFDVLIPMVYDELRSIAHRHRLRWRGNETLGTTALVNEAYLKLADGVVGTYASRAHFLAVVSRAMRQILIDYTRSKRRTKRGAGGEQVRFEDVEAVLDGLGAQSSAERDAVLALAESLARLEVESERHCRIVECRFFGGLTIEETARALGIAPATVKRGWTVAQAWLRRDLAQTI